MVEALCFALLACNVVQFVWWSRQFQTLVDKHMSRNYPEYVASKEYRPLSQAPTLNDAQGEVVVDDPLLRELNQRLGMG